MLTRDLVSTSSLAGALTALVLGGAAHLSGHTQAAVVVWTVGLWLTGAPIAWRTGRGMLHGVFAADILAMLAIIAAALLGEPVAGLVIVAMQTGGESLERYAAGRASRALRDLEAAAPRVAHRRASGVLADIPVARVEVNDELLVRPGEAIPCDSIVIEGRSHVDTSPLTGEPVPRLATPDTHLMSGMLNGEGALVVRVTARSSESQYERIIELVRRAQESRAPLQRLADRYAVWFTPLTLLVCAAVYIATRDPVRVLSILVVATPCPLILAAPVAFVGGISRAARRRIIVRNGAALERLAAITTAAFDKTGTLTVGRPQVASVEALSGWRSDDVLAYAASVEQLSSHLMASSVVDGAQRAGLSLLAATDIAESPGRGVSGMVGGRRISVGAASFVRERLPQVDRDLLAKRADGLSALVAIDDRIAGVIRFADQPRHGLPELFRRLRALGITRTVLLTGDHAGNAAEVARMAGIDDVRADLLPADKVAAIAGLAADRAGVLMVGDGTNDAPALSKATVGIALAGHPGGGGITTEAADVVVLVDDLSRVADAVAIGRETMRIARQSIWAGLGLSVLAIIAAAGGHVTPVAGALLQEVVDIAVILNALRAVREPSHGAGNPGGFLHLRPAAISGAANVVIGTAHTPVV